MSCSDALDEEVLLLDAQTLALDGAVVRVEDAGDVLGAVFLGERALVILRVERVKVELLLGLALPETERCDVVGIDSR